MNLEIYVKSLPFYELKEMMKEMGNEVKRKTKRDLEDEILRCFREYEEYKKSYKVCEQLGNKGKDGVTYLVKIEDKEFAMKTFSKKKSKQNIQREAELQEIASSFNIAPKIIDVDLVNNYIVMEKMDMHLYEVMKKQNGDLTEKQQKEIINIFNKLDEAGVLQNDSNILNYMYKGSKLYVIDFGISKKIDDKLKKKLGCQRPNYEMMNVGFIIKLKELSCPQSSYSYLLKHVSKENKEKYRL
jgi:predicted Ser/Thr protein kinase